MLVFRRFLAALIVLLLIALTLSPLAPIGLIPFWVVLVPTKALDRLAQTGEHDLNKPMSPEELAEWREYWEQYKKDNMEPTGDGKWRVKKK